MSSSSKHFENNKDSSDSVFATGRLQAIPKEPGANVDRPTLAGGGVLWRGTPEDFEVAVIHRPRYDDWSLTKGKVDPGEAIVSTAVREIAEETGYEVALGKLIGKVTYPVGNRTKVIYYWAAQVTGGEFVPNEEVDEMRWLSPADARELLTYQADTQVLNEAAKWISAPHTSRVLLVRHAKAPDRFKWAGDDNRRPLDKKGRRQAEMLVPLLSAYVPQRLYSALPDRCQQTIAPLADELGLPVTVDVQLGDEGWQTSQVDTQRAFLDIIDRGGVSVICSQGEAIPGLLAWLAAHGQLPIDEEIKVKKASVWVLTFNGQELTGADYLASPLPVE